MNQEVCPHCGEHYNEGAALCYHCRKYINFNRWLKVNWQEVIIWMITTVILTWISLHYAGILK